VLSTSRGVWHWRWPHCDLWVHSFMGALPGTTGHPRSFSESYLLRPLPLVLDWAGHCLTSAGRELVADAMILKGLARIESDFRRWNISAA